MKIRSHWLYNGTDSTRVCSRRVVA